LRRRNEGGLSSHFLYIALQHEALLSSGVIGSTLQAVTGPRLDFLLSYSRGALF